MKKALDIKKEIPNSIILISLKMSLIQNSL